MQDLKNLWIQAVTSEYQHICIRHNVMLEYPIFNFHKGEKSLGYWDRESRVLSLSRTLFEKYSWNEVEQVLRHEMAHQMVDELPELFGRGDEKRAGRDKIWSKKRKKKKKAQGRAQSRPHGAEFAFACKILGVEPEFTGASTLFEKDLQRASAWRCQDANNPTVQLIRKVEKLLALSKSANEHEAQAALEKAQDLMEKNHIEKLINEEISYRRLTINLQRKNVAFWQNQLFGLLQDFFMVKVVLTDTVNLPSGEICKAVDIFGTAENVLVAEYCYHFVCNHTAELWKQNRAQFGRDARRHRNSYLFGVVAGFREKLAEQRKQCRPSPLQRDGQKITTALIEQKKQEDKERLDDFVEEVYNGQLTKKRSGKAKVYGDSFGAGHSDGQQLSFSEGLERESGGKRGRLIEQ